MGGQASRQEADLGLHHFGTVSWHLLGQQMTDYLPKQLEISRALKSHSCEEFRSLPQTSLKEEPTWLYVFVHRQEPLDP